MMMTGLQIAERAKEQIIQITGLKAHTVSGFTKDEHGWRVIVEMVEMERIPKSRDILATYETRLDDEGNLLSYERTQRYLREQTMEKEE